MFKFIESAIERVARRAFWDEMWDLRKREIFPEIRVQIDGGDETLIPVRAHDTDAGADIRCRESFTVPAGDSCVVDTGVHIELPPNMKAEVKSKSGLWIKHCILTTGLVDEGYSGPIKVRVANLGKYDYEFQAGEMLTQISISPVTYPSFVMVDEIKGGARAQNGFGSTGK